MSLKNYKKRGKKLLPHTQKKWIIEKYKWGILKYI